VVNDPSCYAYGPIQPDATGLPPGRRLEDVLAEAKAAQAAARPRDPTAAAPAVLDMPESASVSAATAQDRKHLREFARQAAYLEQQRIGMSDEELPRCEYFIYDNLLRRARGEAPWTLQEYWTHKNHALDNALALGQGRPTRDMVNVANASETKSPDSGKASAKDAAADSPVVAPTDVTLAGVESGPPVEKRNAADLLKPHPSNPNISYWVSPASGLTEADVIRAFQIAAVVRAVRRLIAQLRDTQDHPGALRQFSDAFNPFADRFRRDMDETSNLWDLEVLLFELEAEWISKGYDRIEWQVFGMAAGAGLDFAESIVTTGPPHALQEVSVEALLNVAGTAALLKLGGALLARGGMRLLASQSAAVRILPKGEGSVWDLGWSLRGQKIEQELGHNVPPGFPAVDRWIPGGQENEARKRDRQENGTGPIMADAVMRLR
jgi:hypothetical protein